MPDKAEPLVTFWQLIPGGYEPRRATVDASGTLPASAMRYCEPVRTASSLGYHLYLPIDIGLFFDGASGVMWSFDHDGNGIGADWWPLMPEAAFPGFVEQWNNQAPSELHDYVPPFLSMGEDHGLVQIWTGALARTRDNWSLLIRGPVNDARRSLGYDVLEGVVAADRYGGHLFANLKLLKTDQPIMLLRNRPLIQVVPIHRSQYDSMTLDQVAVGGFTDVPSERWTSYKEWIVDRPQARLPGDYAVRERKRRAAEHQP